MRIWNRKDMTLRATLITIWPGSPFSPQYPLPGCEQWEGVAKCKLIWGWRRLDWNNFFFSSRSIRPYAILQCICQEVRNSLLFLSPLLWSSHRTVKPVQAISEEEQLPVLSLKQASTAKAAKGSPLFLLILASTFLKSLFTLLRSAYSGFEHLLERIFSMSA